MSLFYQQFPTKIFHLKDEQCTGGKFSKVSVMGLAAGNDVSQKLPMLVIEKVEKPQCVKVSNAYCVILGPPKNSGWTLISLLIL